MACFPATDYVPFIRRVAGGCKHSVQTVYVGVYYIAAGRVPIEPLMTQTTPDGQFIDWETAPIQVRCLIMPKISRG